MVSLVQYSIALWLQFGSLVPNYHGKFHRGFFDVLLGILYPRMLVSVVVLANQNRTYNIEV